jgi:hypothetical protein
MTAREIGERIEDCQRDEEGLGPMTQHRASSWGRRPWVVPLLLVRTTPNRVD